ncbi:MAG: RHS repeat-associated core domain-containing protein [Betaproteobacteria bacterium]|nr:RHS repeat-associated core domain-containing protein [Betaproteobacteria bacterium]
MGEPFGAGTPEEDPENTGARFEFNLRFPGQYYDKETNTHYNDRRDYNPMTGRYIQADPVGLEGGINLYSYVRGNPISRVDPFGLADSAQEHCEEKCGEKGQGVKSCATVTILGVELWGCECGAPNLGDLKEASGKDLKAAAKADGYNSVEKWKQKELQLDSKSQIYKDSSGNLYRLPRQGSGSPQGLGVRLP